MIIQLESASCFIDDKQVLREINWSVNPGEHWAVMGLNGSGKTSLLNLINGYAPLSEGRMRVLCRRYGAYDWRRLRKNIGYISSAIQSKLYEGETALETVLGGVFSTIGLYDLPRKKDLLLALRALESVKCGHLAERTYGTLSQGEKQKILIARAMASSPKLLIMDEPCSGLDIFSREDFLSGVHALGAGPSPALIYVTHHIEEVLPVFSHVLLLKAGEVHSAGETARVITAKNLSSFFGTPVRLRWRKGRAWMEVK